MAAPNLAFSATGERLSDVSGFDCIVVEFSSDIPYLSFECRATKAGEETGLGKGTFIAAFSQTPAYTTRQFEIYDDFLVQGDGEYRISLFAQGEDGSWNDNQGFIPLGDDNIMATSDGQDFFCMR